MEHASPQTGDGILIMHKSNEIIKNNGLEMHWRQNYKLSSEKTKKESQFDSKHLNLDVGKHCSSLMIL